MRYIVKSDKDPLKLVIVGARGFTPKEHYGKAPLDSDGVEEEGAWLELKNGKVVVNEGLKQSTLAKRIADKITNEQDMADKKTRLAGLSKAAIDNASDIGQIKGLLQLILERMDG